MLIAKSNGKISCTHNDSSVMFPSLKPLQQPVSTPLKLKALLDGFNTKPQLSSIKTTEKKGIQNLSSTILLENNERQKHYQSLLQKFEELKTSIETLPLPTTTKTPTVSTANKGKEQKTDYCVVEGQVKTFPQDEWVRLVIKGGRIYCINAGSVESFEFKNEELPSPSELPLGQVDNSQEWTRGWCDEFICPDCGRENSRRFNLLNLNKPNIVDSPVTILPVNPKVLVETTPTFIKKIKKTNFGSPMKLKPSMEDDMPQVVPTLSSNSPLPKKTIIHDVNKISKKNFSPMKGKKLTSSPLKKNIYSPKMNKLGQKLKGNEENNGAENNGNPSLADPTDIFKARKTLMRTP